MANRHVKKPYEKLIIHPATAYPNMIPIGTAAYKNPIHLVVTDYGLNSLTQTGPYITANACEIPIPTLVTYMNIKLYAKLNAMQKPTFKSNVISIVRVAENF